MMARGFRSVGWVAAVGGAALGCYMLSLQVATERAELAGVEARIISTKQEIRSLQTELGTRGRLSQLERWNADVLALSAPASGQFLKNEFTLARFDQRQKTIEEQTEVRLASLDTAKPSAQPMVRQALAATAESPAAPQAIIHRASFQTVRPEIRQAGLIDDKLTREIGAAAHAEKGQKSEKSQVSGGTR